MDIIRNVFRNFNQTQREVTSSIIEGNNEDIIIDEENTIFTQRIKAKQQYTHTHTHTQNNNNNNYFSSSSSFIKCPCYSISNYHQHHHSHIIPPPTEQQPLLHDPTPDVEYNSYRISFSPISRPPLQTSTTITNNTSTSFLQQALFPSSELSPTTNEDTYRYYYNYAFDKKDTSNYPLFSYHNFLTIQQTSLNTSNYLSQLLYTNICPIPLMSLYIDLLNQRQQQQHSMSNDDDNVQYPFTRFIAVDNYSTMCINANSSSAEVIVVVLCDNRDCMWNVLEVFVDECVCNYYKCCKKEAEYAVIEKVLECVGQKEVKWSVNYVNVFKAIDEEEHNGVMPLIVMDYVARGRKCPAMCKNDLVYYSVLVGIELMDEKMYTYR